MYPVLIKLSHVLIVCLLFMSMETKLYTNETHDTTWACNAISKTATGIKPVQEKNDIQAIRNENIRV